MIIFSETKNIGSKKIFELFESVGWIQKGNGNNDCNDAIANHVLKVNKVNFEDLFQHAFLNSTYVARTLIFTRKKDLRIAITIWKKKANIINLNSKRFLLTTPSKASYPLPLKYLPAFW